MPTNGLNEKVGLDVIGPLPPTERGHRYILAMVDCVTKALEAEPMRSQDAETVAQVYINRWVCQRGIPLPVHSDQGANFERAVFQSARHSLGATKTRTIMDHSQGNEQVDRTNLTLIHLLRSFAFGSHIHD